MAWSWVDKLQSVRQKWSNGLTELFTGGGKVDDDFFEDLEEQLIYGDVGVDLSAELVDELRESWRDGEAKNARDLLDLFRSQLVSRLKAVPMTGAPLRLGRDLTVLLLTGVNGSGKTTTAGKLALRFKRDGYKVVLAAADTFRAAAPAQLQAWGERSGVRVVSRGEGVDPASVVFDGIGAAKADGADLLIVDTAGRLQARANLMSELAKINKIAAREVGLARLENFIVLDSVIGQNAFEQARLFHQAAPLTGAILAKYDNTAKGGIVLSISSTLKIPLRYVGLGEGVDDLQLFDAEGFVDGLLKPKEETR